jgi:pimeloyl-ACP methyl ester carboxylesterase
MNRVPLLFLSLVLILPDALAAEENIALATRTGSLHGTLSLANPPAPGPVVLLIAGSGPTDRDGNSSLLPGRNDHLKLLAEALGSRGISSLRYDKRGVAQSVAAAGRENDLRFETYVDDAVAWAERIKNDSRFSSLTIIGHSEGSLIGMIATQRVTAAGFVSLAGPGRAAPVIVREQLRGAPKLAGPADRILGELEAGRTTDSVPPELQSLFRPSVQPYLISWFRYDPAKEIAKATIPVLIVQGSTDRQVSLEDAGHLKQGNQQAQIRIVPGMNHLLKAVPDDDGKQLASFSDPAIPTHTMLIDEISSFVKAADQRAAVKRH